MKSVILRPLAVFSIAFYILSCILFTAERRSLLISAVIFSFAFAVALSVRAIIPKLKAMTVSGASFKALLFFLAGCALASLITYYTLEIKASDNYGLCNREATVEGTVTDVIWDGGYSGLYIVKVEDNRGLPSFKFLLSAEGGIECNTRISAHVIFSKTENTAQFDEESYYLSQGVYIKGEAKSVSTLGKGEYPLTYLAQWISDRLSNIFYQKLGSEEGGFAAALLLGNKSRLPDTVVRDFQRLGISHILAISGMHLTILCSFVITLMKPFGKRAGNAGCILLVLFYIFVTGLAPTVIRSGIMVLLPIIASDIHRGADRFTLLGVSVFLICIFDPYSAGDIGLQLSFAALMAIFLLSEHKEGLKGEGLDLKTSSSPIAGIWKLISSFLKEAAISTVIILFMLPLTWLYFKQICPAAPLIGPVFSFLCNILLWALPVLLLLSPAPTISSIFAYPLKMIIGFVTSLAQRISSIENITFSLNYPFALPFSIAIFIAVCAFCITKSKKRLAAGAVTIALVISLIISASVFSHIEADRTTVSMLTYKSSDGLCLIDQNKAMIIDIGNGYSGILKEEMAFLKTTRATQIEILMLTHCHKSHIETLDTFFAQCIVRNLLIPETDNKIKDSISRVCQKHGVTLKSFSHDEKIRFETVTVIPKESIFIKRSVQPIVRIDITSRDRTFTYVGAAYYESCPDACLDSDFVFFGDHGPLYKEKYTPNTTEDCRIFASNNASLFMDDSKKAAIPAAVSW